MKYEIQYKVVGITNKFRSNQVTQFFDEVSTIANYFYAMKEDELSYSLILVDGVQVSSEKAMAHCRTQFAKELCTKRKTHKRIWIRTGGVTNARANFKQIWIKK
jgi:ribosomal protein L19E